MVIAVIGAIFIGQTGQVTVESCKTKLGTYCAVWQASGYQGSGPSGGWDIYGKECKEIGVPTEGRVTSEACNKGA